jgi:MFS transporter, OFA family, oxalate/formate antiporter
VNNFKAFLNKKRWNNFPFRPGNAPFFYGWIILGASVIGVLLGVPGQAIGVTIFTDYLIDSVHINRDQISTAYMFGTIGSSFLLTWAGKQYDKYGARWTATGTSFLLAIVLVMLSQADRMIGFFVPNQTSSFYAGFAVTIMAFLFFLLRFTGQGFLPMVSRNMLMKWFIARRGFANGILSVFVSIGFSLAPLTFYGIIQKTSWRFAWLVMAVVVVAILITCIFIFFRDNPEDLGLIPDGEKHANKEHNVIIKPFKQFTLTEAKRTFSFWLFSLPLAVYTLYNAGSTIHLISIFDTAGQSREKALAVFIPIAIMSVAISFFGGWLSDRIKLKYLLFSLLSGEFIALFSLANLNGGIFCYGFILGHGIAGGIYNVLMAVTWPRFYGRKHLGRISGFVISLVVFSSALGPVVFSFSFSQLGSYRFASIGLAFCVLFLLILSFKGNNPQDKFNNSV